MPTDPQNGVLESELEWLRRRNRELEQQLAEQSELLALNAQQATDRARAEELLAAEGKILELIARGAPLREVLTALARTMEAQVPGSPCAIHLLDEDGVHLRCGAAPSLPDDYTATLEGLAIGPDVGSCGTAADSGRRTIVTDIALDPKWAAYRDLALGHGLRSCWSEPIFSKTGTVLGAFAIYTRDPGAGPAPEHLRLMEAAAHLAAIAIERTRADEELRRAHEALELRVRQQSAQLSRSEARWQLALDAAHMTAWEWDIRIDEIRTFGQSLLISGAGALPTTFREFLEIVHPEDRGAVQAAVEEALSGKSDYHVEFRMLQADGHVRSIEARGRASFDEAGRATHLIGVGMDVTERQKAEEALRASEARFRRLAEANIIGVTFVRGDTIVEANDAFLNLVGYSREDLHARTLRCIDLTPPEYAERERRAQEEKLRHGAFTPYEKEYIRQDGRRVPVLHGGAFLDESRTESVSFALDLTECKRTEQAMRESQERFAKIFRASPVVSSIARLDDERLIDVNDTFLRELGYGRDEVIGRTPAELGMWVDPADRLRILEALRASRSLHNFELKCRTRSGAIRETLTSMELIELGGEECILALGLDITERQRAEEALRASEARFAAFMRNLPGTAFIKDLEGRYVYVNQRLEEISGRVSSDWLGKRDDELWPAETAAQFQANDRRILDSGSSLRTIETAEQDGAIHHWLVHKFPIPDQAGRTILLAGVAVDISEQKQAEALLRRERDFAESLIETAQVIVLVLDAQGHIVRLNPYAEALSGYRLEEVRGRDWLSLFVPERERARVGRVFAQILADVDTSGNVNPIVTKDGREREIKWSNTSLKDAQGTVTGVLAIGQDITDLKEAQHRALQAERLAAIGEMVTGLTHESRNALQRSQACLEMLALELKDRPNALDLVAGIQEAQDDLHRLYEAVRDYAAPLLLDRRACRLGDVLHEAWADLAPARKGRAVALREHGVAGTLACAGDRSRLKQVFRNVLDNALAAGRDPVEIDAAWAEVELAGQPAVRIALRDNGPGLNPEQRQRLFEPFYTTKTQGTGLGLAIAKRIVEAHGGQIAVGPDSDRGGAEILITLPRGTYEPPPAHRRRR